MVELCDKKTRSIFILEENLSFAEKSCTGEECYTLKIENGTAVIEENFNPTTTVSEERTAEIAVSKVRYTK